MRMIKPLLIFLMATTLSSCSREHDGGPRSPEAQANPLGLKTGDLKQLDHNLWIQAEEVSYPELRDVILYSRKDGEELQTIRASKAMVQEGEYNIIKITLQEVSLSVGESTENQQTILANSYVFNYWRASNWSGPKTSPFDKQDPVKVENKSFQYKVAEGDDIQSISKMFVVTEAELKRWNSDLKSSGKLDVGQRIWIRGDDD